MPNCSSLPGEAVLNIDETKNDQLSPGPKYADVVSYDNYQRLDDRYYQEILTIANGKPIALGEVGSPPSAEVDQGAAEVGVVHQLAGGVEDRTNALQGAYSNPWFISRGNPLPK